MASTQAIAEWAVSGLEIVGVGLIVIMALYTLVTAGVAAYQGIRGDTLFRSFRHRLTRGILLGLEFLVAADIIKTVAVELTLDSVVVLGLVVLIRTLLSFTLELELTGHWPWQSKSREKS